MKEKNNNSRNLNMAYAIEVVYGRLNGSAEQVETKKSSNKNTTYVKKIGGRGVVSAPCIKYNIQEYMGANGISLSIKDKIEKQVAFNPDPFNYVNDDIFGFMKAESSSITDDEYQGLSKEQQKLYVKSGKQWKQNITKKRKSRLQLSPLVNVSNRRIINEWNICSTSGDSLPIITETYSGIFAGIGNLDIEKVSKFKISDTASEFRDYTTDEVSNEKEVKINIEEKYKRIESVLRGLQYLSISGNQTNYLTDTTPKIVILGEYTWGNNVFQGVLKREGLDIAALKESIKDNEKYRKSDIWIGVSNKIYDEAYQKINENLSSELQNYNFIKIGGIKESFDDYLQHLKKSI